MSLPERIRVFVLKGPTTGKIHKVTFEAAEAVGLAKCLRENGIPIDIEEHIATRTFNALGVIEFRCYPCASHHLVSAEAVDGSDEVHDGCCDAASKRAAAERNDLGPVNASPDPCEDGHDYEDVEVEHEIDEQPVSMNPFTDAIRTKSYRIELVTQRCRRCPAEQIDTRDCKCSRD